MCDPGTAVLAAGQAVNFIQRSQTVREQNRAGRAREALNASLAEQSADRQLTALRRSQIEQREQTANEIQQITTQALEAAGLARVGGGAGQSVATSLQELTARQLRAEGSLLRTQAFADLQAEDEAAGIRQQQHGRLIQGQFVPIPRPSFLNAALGIAGTALQAGTGDGG